MITGVCWNTSFGSGGIRLRRGDGHRGDRRVEEVGKVEVKRQPVKWWIRRHRVLALLAPFLGMAALLFLWGGVEMFFIDRIPSEKPFQELCECVWFALVLASIGMTRVFDMGPAQPRQSVGVATGCQNTASVPSASAAGRSGGRRPSLRP